MLHKRDDDLASGRRAELRRRQKQRHKHRHAQTPTPSPTPRPSRAQTRTPYPTPAPTWEPPQAPFPTQAPFPIQAPFPAQAPTPAQSRRQARENRADHNRADHNRADQARPDRTRGQLRRAQRQRLRRRLVGRRTITVLAGLLVLFALLAPNQVSRLSPGAFLRIPVEGLVAVAAALALPARVRRPFAAVAGAALGLLTIGKFLDMGFFLTLSRPFDLVFDWAFVGNALEFVKTSVGQVGEIGAAVGVVVVAVAVVVLMTLSVLRLSQVVARHTRPAAAVTAALAVGWVISSGLGLQSAPGEPVAAKETINAVVDRARQVRDARQDQKSFIAQLQSDSIHNTPGNRLLTGLRGKDVVVAFVESYGVDAIHDPEFAPHVGAVLADGDKKLQAAGFSSRSAYLTSPTFGGGSWLAQSTLLSGVWANNQQRYTDLVASNHLTLNGAFRRAGWRTVGVVPGVTRAWPEGAFFGFDQIYDSHHLGYTGPHFTWSQIPDQFTLAAFQKLEMSKKNRAPIMAEIPLTSSHIPWAPLPKMVNWNSLGNGTIYGPIAAAGQKPDGILQDPARARTAYRQSIEYTLTSLISYVQHYGNDKLVLVFLGDHQPSPIVTGQGASRDVPITIVAKDPAVLARISGWGWTTGLKPGAKAPVWRMDSFRDRFLTAFGPNPTTP